MITKYNGSKCKVCMYFPMQIKLVNILTYVQILSIKTVSLSHNSNRHAIQYKRPVATWPPVGVVLHSVCFDHARTLNT